MKHLYLIRHAKSNWNDSALSDFDRPLNKRGKRDAPFMGQRLAAASVCPDLIIASSAKRARKTARIISKEIGYPKARIVLTDTIYTSELGQLLEIIRSTGSDIQSLGLVGHNFVITELAEWLTGRSIVNIPTCGIVAIAFDIKQWRKVEGQTGKLVFFDYPKKHSDQRNSG